MSLRESALGTVSALCAAATLCASAPALADGTREVDVLTEAAESEHAESAEHAEHAESAESASSREAGVLRRGPILVDPFKSCANYADYQQALKGDANFIATGHVLSCGWNNSDVQPSITIVNKSAGYLAPGARIFYCTAGGTTGKKVLWGTSLAQGQSMQEFVPFGSGNTCQARAVTFSPRNPPH